MRVKNHQWHADNPGRSLNKRTLISEVARPALEEALARTETITNAFKMTGLYPFNPKAVNRSKLLPGNQYQQPTVDVSVDVDVIPGDIIPGDAVVLQASSLSPQPGPSSAPDLVDSNVEKGLNQGAAVSAESFSCINCAKDKLLSESVHHCHQICQQCVLELASSNLSQGIQAVFCPCGDEMSSEALKPLLPSGLYGQLCEPRAPSRDSPSETTPSLQLKTVPEMTREEKIEQLQKFEFVMLQKNQRKEFQEVFDAGVRHECSSSLYLSWLSLKLDSLESEQEVLERFFIDKTPSNLETKKTTRKVRKPDGSARFDPLSTEWKNIWEDQEKEKKEKEEKKKEAERRALERKEKKKKIEEEKAKTRASSGLLRPPSRGRPKGRLRGTSPASTSLLQTPALSTPQTDSTGSKAGPLLTRSDSPPLQPPPSLPSSPPPSQHQPANVRKRGRRNIPDAEGKLEDILKKKVENNILLNQ